MKNLVIALIVCITYASNAQTDSSKYAAKVASIDATIETLYSVISGDKGEERDWDLFRYLYQKGAQMIPSGMAKDSTYRLRYSDPEDYIENSGKWLLENGFHEEEIHRSVQQFGNIAQVFSTYQCFHTKKDKEPFMRGINSIQLIFDGTRWWVVNIYWSQESESNPIPPEFLPIEK